MTMKKRYIVFTALTVGCLALALIFGCARRSVTKDNVRDFAAETYQGASETNYTQLAVYLTEEDYLTPDGMMGVKNDLESAMTEASIEHGGRYLLSGSSEQSVVLARDAITVDATATVYFGDWFGLHPHLPLKGGYVTESAATTDFCVIDDLAAWRIFGSTDVCGMELSINEKLYTVSAVLAADRSTYASYYGEKPRVYILYSSAAMRDERITFTTLEAVLPDPITDSAKNMFSEAVASYSEDVHVITDRFTLPELWEDIKNMTALGVMEGKTYPYYENVARVMETKCAMLLSFEGAFWSLAAVFLVTLLVLIFYPISKRIQEKRLAKKSHAIY